MKTNARTLIILGSGGHTAEMVEIVKAIDKSKYTPRYYCLAKSDKTSKSKIKEVEDKNDDYKFFEINRSRNVKQSYFTSIFTTIFSILTCMPIVWNTQPDLILANGPGTCVAICLIGYLFRLLRFISKDCKIVFVESFCRVKSISLTGKILSKFVDLFVVQWPSLKSLNSTYKYYGKLN